MRRREIILPQRAYQNLRAHLLQDHGQEEMAFLLGGVLRSDGVLSILVREVVPVPRDGLAVQTGAAIQARPEFVRPILERCHREGLSLVEAHSHPFAREGVTFSGIDTAGEWQRFPFVASKSPHIAHATLVVGQDSVDGHIWLDKAQTVAPVTAVRVVGCLIQKITTTSMRPLIEGIALLEKGGLIDAPVPEWDRYSRQVLAFGAESQRRLAGFTVAVGGGGGIGSHVAQQLAYLGFGGLILVDPDVVEETNCNRLVGATPADIGRPKAEVIAEVVRRVSPGIRVQSIVEPVQEEAAISILKTADIIIGATDTQLSRFVLNTIATQYLIPYIDCGSGFFLKADGGIEAAGGQVRTVLPDGPCLDCMGGIDRQRLGQEVMSPEGRDMQRRAGYGLGDETPQPAVVSLNGVVASLAVMEALNLVSGFRPVQHYVFYDALQQRAINVSAAKLLECVCCGAESGFALGDLSPIGVKTGGASIPSASLAPRDVQRDEAQTASETKGGDVPCPDPFRETPTRRGLREALARLGLRRRKIQTS